jgi:hypothetical protein
MVENAMAIELTALLRRFDDACAGADEPGRGGNDTRTPSRRNPAPCMNY